MLSAGLIDTKAKENLATMAYTEVTTTTINCQVKINRPRKRFLSGFRLNNARERQNALVFIPLEAADKIESYPCLLYTSRCV